MEGDLTIFAGNSNPPLAQEICHYLGLDLGKAYVGTFSDGETWVEILENVRGKDVFVVQSISTPGNTYLMELLIIIDALRRASARRITALLPYYGYARQDRKVAPRTPITAKLVADLITTAGANRLLTVDLHAGQIQGFFNIPVDHLYANPVVVEYIRREIKDNLVMVAPDAGAVERTRAIAKVLEAPLAIVDKRRVAPNVSEIMHIIGEVEGKRAVILDDIVDTGGTICRAAKPLLELGAVTVSACCTHAVLSGDVIRRLEDSELTELVVTNTISLREEAQKCSKIRVLSVAPLLGEAIRRISEGASVSSLFVTL
jgi:ribose-phosphate pyrophosphokinase